MGLPWIAIHTNLMNHPKSLDLADLLGEPMAWARMVAIWAWCAEYAPDGRITGRDPVTVAERFANWSGERGKFVESAIKAGFMERDGDTLVMHDWDAHQGAHIAKAERDAERMRKRRADLAKEKGSATVRERSPNSSRTVREPSRGEERRGDREKKEEKPLSADADRVPPQAPLALTSPAPKPDAVAVQVRQVFEHWQRVMGHPKSALDAKRERVIRARLKSYSVADLCRAVDGCAATPYNMGENERGQRFDDIELICRDASHVDRFTANASGPSAAPNSSGLQRIAPDVYDQQQRELDALGYDDNESEGAHV